MSQRVGIHRHGTELDHVVRCAGEWLLELGLNGRTVDQAEVIGTDHGERVLAAHWVGCRKVKQVVWHGLERLEEVGALDLLLLGRDG